MTERSRWEAALAERDVRAPLLQSWAWGEVQARSGWEVERIWLRGGGQATVLVRRVGPMSWGYVPRGPVPADADSLDALVDWARVRGLARLRVEPEVGWELGELLVSRGFRVGPQVQPPRTMVVLLGSEAEMLAGLKSKTRYKIRKAERMGVLVEEGRDPAELGRQMRVTESRQAVGLPARGHLERMLAELDWSRTYVARVGGEAVAAALVARYGERAYYLHAGSNGRRREAMPNYAVQWAVMRAAAVAGCRDYDLWGVAPPHQPAHRWARLSEFKSSFGGISTAYVGAWELVLAPGRHLALEVLEQGRRHLARRWRAGFIPHVPTGFIPRRAWRG